MPTIHPQPHDVPMDFVVTEAGVHRVGTDGLVRVSDPREALGLAEDLLRRRAEAVVRRDAPTARVDDRPVAGPGSRSDGDA